MTSMPTKFAPAERATAPKVLEQHLHMVGTGSMALSDAMPQLMLVLNSHRQLVHCNQAVLQALGIPDASDVLGKRPGEILGCVYASKEEGGCGTTEFCQECGAVKAILKSLEGLADVQECRMLRQVEGQLEALNLRVQATPFSLGDETYSIFTVTDISHEKRRRSLERIFFHDLLNTAGGLRGILEVMAEVAQWDHKADLTMIYQQFHLLVDEILAHKELTDAENHELAVRFQNLDVAEALERAAQTYRMHQAASGKTIVVAAPQAGATMRTDSRLLSRILGNMLKNALEATPSGGQVHLSANLKCGLAVFSVHNPGFIPRKVQLQIFKRSFSTKGEHRGLGTFSIKLLAERYLHGRASFASCPQEGTTFQVELPLTPPETTPAAQE